MIITLWSCVALLVFVQIARSEDVPDVPEECKRPPPFVEKPLDCCRVPQMFTDEDLAECGFKKGQHGPPPGPGAGGRPPFPPPPGPPPCDKEKCLLKKYSLLKDDESVDTEAMKKFIDEQKAGNEEFSKAFDKAKEQCLSRDLGQFGPPFICEPIKLMMCMSTTIFAECPTWAKEEKCNGLKQHIDKCKAFMFH